MTVSSALDLWGFQEGRIRGLPGSGPPGELHLSWNTSTVNAVMEYGHEGRAWWATLEPGPSLNRAASFLRT